MFTLKKKHLFYDKITEQLPTSFIPLYDPSVETVLPCTNT